MTDDAFWSRLNERLDDRRPLGDDRRDRESTPDDDSDRRALLGAASALREAVSQLRRPVPSDGLEDRVFAALALPEVVVEERTDERTGWVRWAVAVGAAVGLAAAFAGFSLFMPQTDVAVNPPVAPAPNLVAELDVPLPQPTPDESIDGRPKPLHELLAEAQRGYAALAVETQSSFGEVALLFPDLASTNMGPEPSAADRASEWLDGVKGELPTPSPLNDALQQLWNATTFGDDQTS